MVIMAPWRCESPGALDALPPAQPHILKIGQIISHSQNRACSSKAEHSCLGAQRRRRGGRCGGAELHRRVGGVQRARKGGGLQVFGVRRTWSEQSRFSVAGSTTAMGFPLQLEY